MLLLFGRMFGYFQLFAADAFFPRLFVRLRCCCRCIVVIFVIFAVVYGIWEKFITIDERKLSAAIIFICVIMRTRAYSTFYRSINNKKHQNRINFRCEKDASFSLAHNIFRGSFSNLDHNDDHDCFIAPTTWFVLHCNSAQHRWK